jgi:hypothetical protein
MHAPMRALEDLIGFEKNLVYANGAAAAVPISNGKNSNATIVLNLSEAASYFSKLSF